MAKVAAQMYTVRDYCKTAADIARSLARVRQIGYEAVQLSGLGPIDPEELKRMLDGEGLRVAATHVAWQELQDDPERVIDRQKIWACEDLAIASMPKAYRTPEGFTEFGREAGKVARKLAESGLRLSYHNHSFEFQRVGRQPGLAALFDAAGPDLSAEVDTYWVQHGGADPADWIRRFRGRVPLVHLKDMVIVNDAQAMAEVGEGNLNWPAILSALEEAGTRWYMVEQDICPRDPFESLAMSRENLLRWGVE